ncbi:NAD(P)/FAD-dependent oxidoreductase [Metallumcola ferriviriculae]|uniref:NAD(P)/FAD-dependent oxidoreductase n=1 Tax=Metallumcola ferriviriculae TaxID=3039180 RepID=A0AAU0UMJ7_9FIRM|nr:NAD(P)/FAD-dependent oxidoreductase [Desulfitibacteraceae bacterium MK1]
MITTDIVVIGAGPAGLNAAITAASMGANVLLLERNVLEGGQLIKQTHKFFGSKAQHAAARGIDIAKALYQSASQYPNVTMKFGATVLGYYEDGVITAEHHESIITIKAKKYIVATGAAEKSLPFPNNDLPGIYGAGAVQTLTNVYGVLPGKKVLMIGSGNIGLIVSYQLLQAGVQVAGIVEAAPEIGGYLVHAAKIRRAGVPIYTSYTIKEAYGTEMVEGALIMQLDKNWQPLSGTEIDIPVDVVCIAVGLTPLTELLWQAGCKMKYVPQLGGHIPVRDENLTTTVSDIYVAGDVSGIEEASAAMVEGKLAGAAAASSLGYGSGKFAEIRREALAQLAELRSGPAGAKIRKGLKLLVG